MYTPIQYQIAYLKNQPLSTNEITGATSNSIHYYDELASLTTNGYRLIGWHFVCWVDENGNEYIDGVSVKNLANEQGREVKLYAQWEQNEYTVKYISNKPSTATSQMNGIDLMTDDCYDYEENVKFKKNQFSMVGWHFTNWNVSPSGNGSSFLDEDSIPSNIKNKEEIVLYAQWEQNDYTVIYQPNKPDIASNVVVGNTDSSLHKYDLTSLLAKNGYTLKGWHFLGWNTVRDGTGTFLSDQQGVSTLPKHDEPSIVLYAQWEQNEYTVKYLPSKPSLASNSITGNMAEQRCLFEGAVTLLNNNYNLKGWEFIKWQDDEGNKYNAGQTVSVSDLITDENLINLYASWKAKSYNIIYNANHPIQASAAIQGNMNNSTHTYDLESLIAANNFTLIGWHFVEWNTQANGTGEKFADSASVKIMPTNDDDNVNLYAQWERNVYYINYVSNYPQPSSGVINGSVSTTRHYYDTPSNITSNVYELYCWKVSHWSTSANGGEKINIAGSILNRTSVDKQTINLYAQWIEKPLNECTVDDSTYYIATKNQFCSLRSYAANNWTYNILADFDVENWTSINTFKGYLNLQGHTITYQGDCLARYNYGTITNGTVKPSFFVQVRGTALTGLGGVSDYNHGTISNIKVESKLGNASFMNTSGVNTDIRVDDNLYSVGAIAGLNYGTIYRCENKASLGVQCSTGGIVGLNMENAIQIYVY